MLSEQLLKELREILIEDLNNNFSNGEIAEIARSLVELFELLIEAYEEEQKNETHKKRNFGERILDEKSTRNKK
jgi:hypothetical protein